jgi:histidinol dehydrogenase
VIASQGNASWIAADLLAQAEHAPDATSILVTTSPRLAREVQRRVAEQLTKLPEDNQAQSSLKTTGAILLVASPEGAFRFVNRFAPEHLSLPQYKTARAVMLERVSAAGTVFIGPWAAQPFGDYATGSNHVLPTAGWARSRAGLSAADFVKCISVQTISRKGFRSLAADVRILAQAENLLAHDHAVAVRL